MNVNPIKITITARKVARSYGYQVEAEDLEQSMYASLLEQQAVEPDFDTKNTESYVMQKAEWAARQEARKQVTYRKYNAQEKYVKGDDDDDDDDDGNGGSSIFEIIPTQEFTIERHEKRMEIVSAISALDATCQKIVAMLYEGFTQVEIAAKLGLTPAAISQKKRQIAAIMAPLLA